MEPEPIIQAFLKVAKNQSSVFSSEALDQLPLLDQTLTELEDQPIETVAKAIKAWCKNHPQARDAIKKVALSQSREIQNPSPGNPSDQETIIINKFPVPQVRQAIQDLINTSQPKSEQSESQKS